MTYFPIIEIAKDIFRRLVIFYACYICFHRKYNQQKFTESFKYNTESLSFIAYLKSCPTFWDKLDYICGHILNVIIPAGIWVLAIWLRAEYPEVYQWW